MKADRCLYFVTGWVKKGGTKTYSSPNESPDQGEERSQMIGWSPRAEVGAPSVSRSREEENQSWIRHRRDQMGWRACQDSGKRKTEISWTIKKRNPTFKPDSKNKINAVNQRIKKKKKKKRRKKNALQRKVV